MKVLMLAASYFPSDVRIYKEALALKGARHDVHVICLNEKTPTRVKGIQVHRMPLSESKLRPPWNWIADYLLYWFFSLLYGYFFLLKTRPRALHVHNPPDFTVPFFLPARLFGVKLVFDVHDPTHVLAMTRLRKTENSVIIRFLKFSFSLAAKSSNHVVTVSDSVAKLIPKNAVIVPNYPDDSFFNGKPVIQKERVAVYAGAMVPRRGLDLLVKAMSQVKGKLLMVGDGDYLEELKRMAPSNVEFTGQVPHSRVPEILENAMVAVLPFEPNPINSIGSPNKLYEYMASGKAVVCVDLPGARAIGRDAVLFIDYSEKGFANGINQLFDNPEKAASLGKKARQIAEKEYRWSDAKKVLLKLYAGF